MRLQCRAVLATAAAGSLLSAYPLGAQGPASGGRTELPPLHHEAASYDTDRQRLIVYGGSRELQGTWAWDSERWLLVADSAASPPPRDGAVMGYDPVTRRTFLFGGWRGVPWMDGGRAECETWVLEDTRWSQRAGGPCITDRVRDNSLVHDSRRGVMLLVDGVPEIPPAAVRPVRLWRWTNDAWQLIDSAGPRRLGWNRAAYDQARGVLVMPIFEGPDRGVWEWNGATWRRIEADGPGARHVHALAWDSRLRRIVLVGGQTHARPAQYLDDAWTWDGQQWSPLADAGAASPIARAGGRLFDDPGNARLLYFGGYRGNPPLQEFWVRDSSGWRPWQARAATIALTGPQALALSVPDLDASARWYGELFGLVQRMDVRADSNTRVRILASDLLTLELISDRRARSISQHAGAEVQSTHAHGFFKAALMVPDLGVAVTVLRARGITIDGLWPKSGTPNLMLRDNSGNLLQLVERRP